MGPLALPGMVLLWFSPARVGKHLERAGWGAAILAHLLGLTVGWGFLWWPIAYTEHHPFAASPPDTQWWVAEFHPPFLTLPEYVRAPFAVIVVDLHRADPTIKSRWPYYLVGWGVIEVAMLLMAMALMPYATAGERAGPLFGRCLRLTWWSTSVFAAGGVLTLPYWWARGHWNPANGLHEADVVALLGLGLWWFLVWLRSGYGYAGPAEGPAWETRVPSCEGCGYNIARLPHSTNCPECGRPVIESLPNRRRPTTFATARGLLNRFNALRFTMRDAVFDQRFFERLSVTSHHDKARSFFFVVCWVIPVIGATVVVALLLLLSLSPTERLKELAPELLAGAVFWVACFFVQVLLGGLVCVAVAAVERREVRTVSTTIFHAASFLTLATVGVLFVCVAVGLGANVVVLDLAMVHRLVLMSAGLAFAVVGIVWVWRAFRTLRRALVVTRWASG